MRINPLLKEKIRESVSSVLPITAIVLLLSVSIVPAWASHPGAMIKTPPTREHGLRTESGAMISSIGVEQLVHLS